MKIISCRILRGEVAMFISYRGEESVHTINEKPAPVGRLLQAPRAVLESKVLTMLDIFDSELALFKNKDRDGYISAATKTAARYACKPESIDQVKSLLLHLRLLRVNGAMASRAHWGIALNQAESFFSTHRLQ
jgi:hypothetical protein